MNGYETTELRNAHVAALRRELEGVRRDLDRGLAPRSEHERRIEAIEEQLRIFEDKPKRRRRRK
jgi:hypothetical protein